MKDADTISYDEYEDLLDADIIRVGQNAAGQSACAVVEIGFTVSSAVRRARALAKATGAECQAIVVGQRNPAGRAKAGASSPRWLSSLLPSMRTEITPAGALPENVRRRSTGPT